MASFDDLALQYVVYDDEAVMGDLASKAAKAIEDAGASRTAVGNWAASIKLWIRPEIDASSPGKDGGESGNAITRAKAISFLAATLKVLNKDLLKADQVELLGGFFGSLFKNDHKAGITPATEALKQLATAKNFKPEMAVKIIEDVSEMKEDFRLQTAATRLEVYELLLRLVQDPAIIGELQHKYGASSGFILDLLNMCQNERDPKNLMVWFKIIKTLVADYSPSDDVTGEVFKAFSNYFPITIRESTTPIGVTPEDLKGALRECFSAHQRLAHLTFPYLIQRLDQSDSMKVTVKNDILMTLKSCVDNYQDPTAKLIPFIPTIWSSLKYEVRNGEVKETIDGALSVLRAVGTKLQDDPPHLNEYINTVFTDSLGDLSDPTYVTQAGKVCLAVISSSPQAFVSHSPKLVDSVIQKIPLSNSVPYIKDLLDLLYAIFKARQALVMVHPDNGKLLAPKSATHFQNLFQKVYLPLWQKYVVYEGGPEIGLLKGVTSGVAMLVAQEVVLADGRRVRLCSDGVCSEICSLFTHRLLMPLNLSPKDAETLVADVDIGLQEALSTIVTNYMEGFATLVSNTTAQISSRDWKHPQKRQVDHLWQVICRVSFIGCSQLPTEAALAASAEKKYTGLHHFLTWTGALLRLTETFLANGTSSGVTKLMIAAIHHSMFCFRDALEAGAKQVNLQSDGKDSIDWARVMKEVLAGARTPTDWVRLFGKHNLDIYESVTPKLGENVPPKPEEKVSPAAAGDKTQTAESNGPDVFANFIRLCLFVVRHLVRLVTKESAGLDGHSVFRLSFQLVVYPEGQRREILEHIERMAPMAIQALDAPSQRLCKLHMEAFRFFRDTEVVPPYWNLEGDGALNLLTLSILKGLWPDAMTDLYKPDGIAQTLLCDTVYTPDANLSQGQAWILALLANKYKASSSAFDFTKVVQFWQSRLEQNMSSFDPKAVDLETDIERVLSILVGAMPRQDKAILSLIPTVHKVVGLPNAFGRALAQGLEAVVGDNEYLKADMHAVIKPLYKQWTYAHLVKPMYGLVLPKAAVGDAAPSKERRTTSENYTLAILGVLNHCPFAVYQDDIPSVASLVLTVLHDVRDLRAIEAALRVLREIFRNDHAALRYQLRAIIRALTDVYRVGLDPAPAKLPAKLPKQPAAAAADPAADRLARKDRRPVPAEPACRLMVLQILGDIPPRYEDRYILSFKGDMNSFFDSCCGDPVRELRRAAVDGREAWFGL